MAVTVSHYPPVKTSTSQVASIRRWKRRSRLIRALRILLPALIVLTVAALAATVAYNTLARGPSAPSSSDEPIRLVNPRFVGRDDRGRAFVLTAVSATRDPRDYQRVLLDKPALVLDEEGPDPLRITGGAGVYHEGNRKLEVSGGVHLSGAKAAFETAESLFDTKTGELVGSGPIQGSGSLGEITAKSYGVYDKGDRLVFKGGVHTRLDKQ
jgi:lipopolysaccharide export system protein LptC